MSRWQTVKSVAAAASKKAEEAKTDKFESEDIETIGKKGAEYEPFEVKA